MPFLRDGRFRALAMTTKDRSADFPDIPTLAESGIAGFDVTMMTGLLAPAGTPGPVVDALNTALNAALKDSNIQEKLHRLGGIAHPSTPAQFQAFLMSEEAEADALIKSGALKSE